MADQRLLPSPLAADERSRALFALTDRLDAMDLAPLLVYRIDSVPASALFPLAWQLGVTGLAGWDLATTEAQRRALLARAIELHRHKGTPWAIRQAFAAAGFPAITLREGVGRATRNGTLFRNGTVHRSPGGAWANVTVDVGPADDGRLIGAEQRRLLRGVFEVWKPARSRLVDLRVKEYVRNGRYLRDRTAIRSGVAIADRSLPVGYAAGAGGYTHTRASEAVFTAQIPDLIAAYVSGESAYSLTRASTATYTASV